MTTATTTTATGGVVPAVLSLAVASGRSPLRPIASTTRDRPRIRLSRTPSMAVMAPTAINAEMSGAEAFRDGLERSR